MNEVDVCPGLLSPSTHVCLEDPEFNSPSGAPQDAHHPKRMCEARVTLNRLGGATAAGEALRTRCPGAERPSGSRAWPQQGDVRTPAHLARDAFGHRAASLRRSLARALHLLLASCGPAGSGGALGFLLLAPLSPPDFHTA